MSLGNDALLAARPYTPAQLASACVLAGFDIIIPPSTGDEIVAAAYLDGLRGRADHTVIACACPHVRARVEESPFGGIPRVAIASPPVAAARYLRAWQLQAVLDESLRERFDEDWWRNPKAGPWISGELFGHGQRELADEQAQRVAGKGLSFAPVIAAIERMVA